MIPRIARTFALLLLLLLPAVALCAPAGAAQDPTQWPRPSGPVADYANVLGPEYRQRITAIATELWQKADAAVVAATIPSLEGRTIEEVAVELFERWGIGRKGSDRGVLILVAVAERRLRIEVGYGLEGVVTDAMAGQIRDKALVPYLKKDQFGPGLLSGVATVAAVVARREGVSLTGVPEAKPVKRRQGLSGGIFFIILLVFMLVIGARARRRGGSGVIPALILGSMLGGGGRGGGFGGFGGGGGFGGFGGGMSGGGGASGGF